MTPPEDVVCKPAVRWLSPTELFHTGLRATLAGAIGQFTDNREQQQGPSFQQGAFRHGADGTEFWLDYVSDTGDGFDATYSVASLLACDPLRPEGLGTGLPRGEVLVMGGDQVYPTAEATAYEERTTRVFALASPPGPARSAALYAVPGNHDWYDGLTAFLRVFGQQAEIGSWQTHQSRSYFALRLPAGWWLLGIDIQLDTYIDKPQLDYFRDICEQQIEEDASVIVCTAKPSWYRAGLDPDAMDRLLHFLRYSLGGKRANVRLLLTGDQHHYARYRSPQGDQHLITAGHGGAYMSPTHLLRDELPLPAELLEPASDRAARTPYARAPGAWPPADESRKAERGVLTRLVVRNWRLLLVFSALYWLLFVSLRDRVGVSTVLLVASAAAGCVAFTRVEDGGPGRRLRYGAGLALVECVPLVGAGVLFAWFQRDLPLWGEFLLGFVTGLVGGLLAAELLALWLWLVARRRVNTNELFAAQSIEDFKGFVRIRIAPDGVLTVFPIGLRRSVRTWRTIDGRLVPAAADGLRAELIEPPFDVPPVRPG